MVAVRPPAVCAAEQVCAREGVAVATNPSFLCAVRQEESAHPLLKVVCRETQGARKPPVA